MYRNAYQRGMLTIFFSVGSKPLEIWDTHTQDGYITRFLDQDIKSMVLEILGTNVSTTYMTCPKGKTVLGITMPFLVMIVKNLKKYFSFEVTILDETGTRRRFRVSNFQSTTQILPLCTVMPIGLSEGWNQIQFNLAEFTRRAYNKQFVEVQKLKINANIRLRRIYFTERLVPEDQLPPEYKLYFPLAKSAKAKKGSVEHVKENVKPSTSLQIAVETPIEEKKGSKVDITKQGSKASLRSLRKSTSHEVRISQEKIQEVPEENVSVSKHSSERTESQTVVKSGTDVFDKHEASITGNENINNEKSSDNVEITEIMPKKSEESNQERVEVTEETQATEETQVTEEIQVAEETQVTEEIQVAEETQVTEETQVADAATDSTAPPDVVQ
ncbi:uncharacterized protein LOC101735446 [Bombyx mori]|uniref:CFA20 domain-containing protein n=1 Tax=Bombyx mori TaxID=7091 RepID=A0A8R1WF39_BOMMO|nr:uncharacterized protein LOC101735446 [Bombyx mori]